ncbi:MAG: OmpH family outer membrane protein [Prevotellaceae bacterium]|jgi:outer membrane protein|nr:OmpH family outer membrane protein [Prevotellaceae bacterium]
MFKKITKVVMIAITVIFITGAANAQQERLKIAVMDFTAGVGLNQSDVDGISNMLTTALFDTRKFTIIERTQIEQAIKEQNFQRNNLSTSQIAKIGQILGVKKILIGNVNIVFQEYNIDVRIIDVESGVVESTAGKTVKSSGLRDVMSELANELVDKITLKSVIFTQSQIKIAYVNRTNIIQTMPEYKEAIKSLEQYSSHLQDELEKISNNFDSKLTAYQNSENSMSDYIKEQKQKEIQELSIYHQEQKEQAQLKLQQKQNNLFEPIMEKLNNIIQNIADENGFAAVLDDNGILIYKKGLIDATQFVKRKIGL